MGELIRQVRMRMRRSSGSDGFSLVEVVVSTGILATGLLSLAAYMAYGLRFMAGSSYAVLAREKAREAVESVHTARDTGRLSWAKIQNKSQTGGVFIDGFTNLTTPGADGLVNTDDDGAVEQLRTPGPDGILNNTDDQLTPLTNFSRRITISELFRDGTTIVNPSLRQIVVTIRYTIQGITREYSITTYVSSYS
jgi:type II secretory pathway pseudopilin PulG